MKNARNRIFEIIELADSDNRVSAYYDFFMMAVIFISLVPLAFKNSPTVFQQIDLITASIFVFDYILRLLTADLKLGKGWVSFVIYPFTAMAIIDLVSILPSFTVVSTGMKTLRLFRMFRTFRAFRAVKVFKSFKLFRYSRSISIIIEVIKNQKTPLLAVGTLAIGYILIAALIIFNIETETFGNYFDAIYWATVSLTTVGYGDIYPISTAGRIVAMLSSFVGIAIVALPSGIITAGYMDVINSNRMDNHASEDNN